MGSMGGSIGANIGSLWFNRISGSAVDVIGAAGGNMGSPTGSIGASKVRQISVLRLLNRQRRGENMGSLTAQSMRQRCVKYQFSDNSIGSAADSPI